MQFFPDGARVRLRSRATGRYIHALEDGVRVALRAPRASLNSVWAVHRLQRDGATYVLLHGAAYGRYLALREVDAPPGAARRACNVFQVLYDAPEQDDVLWRFRAAGDGNDDVHVRNRRYGVWRDDQDQSTRMRLVVEAVPARSEPPGLPEPIPPVPANGGAIQPVPQRVIRYMRADDHGNFLQPEWGMMLFDGRFVFDLRRYLAGELDVADEHSITLCVRAGSQGRLTPLVVDLPSVLLPMHIVVLAVGSPAANGLVYPDADAA